MSVQITRMNVKITRIIVQITPRVLKSHVGYQHHTHDVKITLVRVVKVSVRLAE
jgi:hypothetical protein